MNDDQGDDVSSSRNYLPDAINSIVNEIINKRLGVQRPPDRNVGSTYTEKQFTALVELMDRQNIKLLPGIEGRVKHDNMWLKISKQLNSIEGGCNKTADEWKKIWNNKKRLAKRKFEKNPLSITLLEDKIVRISQRNDFDPDEDGPNLGMQSEEIVIEPHFSEFDMFEGGSSPVSPAPAEPPVTPQQTSIPPQQQPVQLQQSSLPQQQPSFQTQKLLNQPQQQPIQMQPSSIPPHRTSVPPKQPSFPAQQPPLPHRQPSISAQHSSFTPQQPLNSAKESSVTSQQSLTSAQQTSLTPQPPLFQLQQTSVPVQKPPVPEQKAPSTVSHISSSSQKPNVTQETIVIDPMPGPSTTNPRKREAPKAGTAANVYDYKVKQARLQLEKSKEMNRRERELLRLELESRRIEADEQLTQALNRLADITQKLIDKFG